MSRQINAAGLELIKTFEGLKLNSYKDIVGVWTIGYGHTKTAGPGQTITKAQAENLLRQDVSRFEDYVNRLPGADKLNENQFAALVSLAFNVGSFGETLKAAIKAGDKTKIVETLQRYKFAGGKEVPGLVRRRKAEAALFNSGDEKKKPLP